MKKLTTERLITPIGIDAQKPLFAWQSENRRRGQKQVSYRVFVASSKQKLDNKEYDMWDSGLVKSDASFDIQYGGVALQPRTEYWWRAEVTDNFGVTHSAVSHFETGLMEEDAFDGVKWLTRYNENHIIDENSPANARSFTIETQFRVKRQAACLVFGRINSDNFFKLTLQNGPRLSCERFINGMGYCLFGHNMEPTEEIPANIENLIITLKVEVNEGKISTYLNDTPVGKSVSTEVFPIAAIGVNQLLSKSVDFKYIKVTLPDGTVYFNEDFSDPDNCSFAGGTFTEDGFYNIDKAEIMAKINGMKREKVVSAPMFRREFAVKNNVKSARLYATAAGVYDVLINGKNATNSYLNPGRTTYPKRLMYQTFDVTECVSCGKNAIGVVLGHGWWNGADDNRGTLLGFTCKLIVTYADGSEDIILPDENWLYYGDGPVVYDDIFNGQTIDARKNVEGWACPEFADTQSWQTPILLDKSCFPIGKILAQNIPLSVNYTELKPVSITEPVPNVYVYDFGQNIAGICRIKFKGSKGTEVTIRHAEKLFVERLVKSAWEAEDDLCVPGTIWTKNLRNGATITKAHQKDKYILNGNADGEIYEPSLIYHGFQYVEITGLTEPVPAEDIRAIVITTELEDTGKFECSNQLINKFVSNTRWSQIDNFLSVPTDCPQRNERKGWTGDAQIFARTGAYLKDVNAFLEKFETDMADVRNPNGNYPEAAPGWNTERFKGGWSEAGVIIAWQMYHQYGNRRIIEDNYEYLKKFVDGQLAICGKEYIDKKHGAYGDWLAGEPTPVVITETAYAAYACHLFSKMARIIGKIEDAETYLAHFEKYKAAWNREFLGADGTTKCDPAVYGEAPWGPKNENGIVNTQTSYVLGLQFELIPEELRSVAAKKLVECIEAGGYHIRTGFLGVSYILPVLSSMGYSDVAFKMMEQTEHPSWLYAVVNGATSIYETWHGHTVKPNGDVGYASSFNHYSYGSSTEWLFKNVAGIERDEAAPAFKHIILQPTVGGTLQYVNASYNSQHGLIVSNWKREEDGFNYEAEVPANTTATVLLPKGAKIFESGVEVSRAEGVSSVTQNGENTVIDIMSGKYNFSIKY